MAGLFRWDSKAWALVLGAMAFFACRKDPAPVPSASASARASASNAPSASSAPSALVDADPCSSWTLEGPERAVARGALEVWCKRYGPCPENPTQALTVFPGIPPHVRTTDDAIVLGWGKPGIRAYVFDRKGRLIGARNSSDVPNGDCRKIPVFGYVAGSPEPPEVGDQSCAYVAGRDLLAGPACLCKRPEGPTILPSRKTVKASLSCLYEFGVAGGICAETLAKSREKSALYKRKARESRDACQRTHVGFPELGHIVDCVYAADGSLVELRWGTQYVSETYFAPCAK